MTCRSCGNQNKLNSAYCSPCQDHNDREVRIEQTKADYYTHIEDVPEGPIKDTLEAIFTLIEER